MKTVAIIAEYNPFHNGHKHQIDQIRKDFGKDTRIIAIMSGNFTQRGEVAIFDRRVRAEAAVRCGVDLVLLLPFPHSLSSAEFFAAAGVTVADRLGVVDYLSFGSESGDCEALLEIAKNMQKRSYLSKLSSITKDTAYKTLGYPRQCEIAYYEVFGKELSSEFFSPNNILAIEYIKALLKQKSKIKPHTVKRLGADFSCPDIVDCTNQSATALRQLIQNNDYSALDYVPKAAKECYLNAFKANKAPCDGEKLSSAVITNLRLNSPSQKSKIHDCAGGLYNRLIAASDKADSISSLVKLADTKKFTSSRIRRVIWYSLLGVTSSKVKKMPLYTQALAMNSVGMAILKEVKKMTDFPVITKPSQTDLLSDEALEQKLFSDACDSVFQLTKPLPDDGNYSLITTPFIMKDDAKS